MGNDTTMTLDKGVFTISLDFELIWGTLDLFGPEAFRQGSEAVRGGPRRVNWRPASERPKKWGLSCARWRSRATRSDISTRWPSMVLPVSGARSRCGTNGRCGPNG